MLQVPQGNRTEACLRNNISVGVQYLEAWLGGMGCVPLHNLMEDAATAEIGRTQVWQWINHKATLDNKDVLTVSRFNQVRASLHTHTDMSWLCPQCLAAIGGLIVLQGSTPHACHQLTRKRGKIPFLAAGGLVCLCCQAD